MATIHKNHAGISGSTDYAEMQTFVENYWGSAAEEKIYPIPFWKLNQLISVSPTEQAALHVTDFDNRSLVDAQWETYNEDFDDLLANAGGSSEFYFVLHESVFQDIRDSIPTLTTPINQVVIWGRLGKATPDGSDFTAFIMPSKCELIPPGSGGPGTISGAKIPPPA